MKYLMDFIVIGMLLFIPISGYAVYAENNQRLQIVSKVIAAEACSEGTIGMYAVANTIKNRAIKYNKVPYEIVTQPNQFYGYTNPNRDQIYQQCKEDSDYLTGTLMDLIDITDGALYYLLPNEARRSWHKTKTVTIKNHTFYK